MKTDIEIARSVKMRKITDVAAVKKELGRFGEWVEGLFPRIFDMILEIALAFVVIVIGMKLIGWIRKLLKKSLEKM